MKKFITLDEVAEAAKKDMLFLAQSAPLTDFEWKVLAQGMRQYWIEGLSVPMVCGLCNTMYGAESPQKEYANATQCSRIFSDKRCGPIPNTIPADIQAKLDPQTWCLWTEKNSLWQLIGKAQYKLAEYLNMEIIKNEANRAGVLAGNRCRDTWPWVIAKLYPADLDKIILVGKEYLKDLLPPSFRPLQIRSSGRAIDFTKGLNSYSKVKEEILKIVQKMNITFSFSDDPDIISHVLLHTAQRIFGFSVGNFGAIPREWNDPRKFLPAQAAGPYLHELMALISAIEKIVWLDEDIRYRAPELKRQYATIKSLYEAGKYTLRPVEYLIRLQSMGLTEEEATVNYLAQTLAESDLNPALVASYVRYSQQTWGYAPQRFIDALIEINRLGRELIDQEVNWGIPLTSGPITPPSSSGSSSSGSSSSAGQGASTSRPCGSVPERPDCGPNNIAAPEFDVQSGCITGWKCVPSKVYTGPFSSAPPIDEATALCTAMYPSDLRLRQKCIEEVVKPKEEEKKAQGRVVGAGLGFGGALLLIAAGFGIFWLRKRLKE